MKISLLALDYDGTLRRLPDPCPPETAGVLNRVMGRGIRVSVATGRPLDQAREIACKLSLNAPLICYQGGMIYDPNGDTIIDAITMPLDEAKAAWRILGSMGVPAHVYLPDGKCYTPCITAELLELKSLTGVNALEAAELLDDLQTPPIKFLIGVPEAEIEAVVADLQARLGPNLSVVRSWSTLAEVTHRDVNKGRALARLAAHLGVPMQETMAIGDQDNDVDMIRLAGLGVAMGDASAGAKEVADYIAPPLSENGALCAIEKFLL